MSGNFKPKFILVKGDGGRVHEDATLRIAKGKAIHAVRFMRLREVQTQCGTWIEINPELAYDSKYAPTCRKCFKWWQRQDEASNA